MNKKHQWTLNAIFEEPVRADVEWKAIEKMVVALGGKISEGRGSRVRIYLNGVHAVFHRPHPKKETDKGTLKSLRRLLEQAGVRP